MTGKLGLFYHIYYIDIAPELLRATENIPVPVRLYISTDTEEKKRSLAELFAAHAPEIRVLPNRGWDIAPFIVGFADRIRECDLCLKLHAKKSLNYAFGDMWREFLLAELAGSPAVAGGILEMFERDENLGMVAPAHWLDKVGVRAPSPNNARLVPLLKAMGIPCWPDMSVDFPSGSMFWCRSRTLLPLLDVGLGWESFAETQDDKRDFTLAHAVERAFFYSCAASGLTWTQFARARVYTKSRYAPGPFLSAIFFMCRRFSRAVREQGMKTALARTAAFVRRRF